MTTFYSLSIAAFILICSVSCEVVEIRNCRDEDTKCTINEVRVSPCPETEDSQPCKIKRGRSASISFDYTPDFDAETAKSLAYWAQTIKDVPLAGMNMDACNFSTCPIKKGEKYTYTHRLDISKKYPISTYDVKWKLWNTENEQHDQCCFIVKIKVVK